MHQHDIENNIIFSLILMVKIVKLQYQNYCFFRLLSARTLTRWQVQLEVHILSAIANLQWFFFMCTYLQFTEMIGVS